MKHDGLRQRLLGTIVLLLLALTAVRAQDEMRYPALPNFHQINAQLYRGAQPKAGGLAQLARLGVKTIINLRGADEHTRAEEQEARALGMTFYDVALPGFSRPADTAVEHVLGLIADPQLQPVFIHCKRGADRTGTIIACYRIMHDQWTAQRALAEAKRDGMSWLERGMKHYVKDFARRHATPAEPPAKTISRLWPRRQPALCAG